MSRFLNPHLSHTRRTLWDFFLWKIGYYDDHPSCTPPPSDFCYPVISPPFQRALPSALWIGHCTFLIEVVGFTVLTDPIWSSHCSPLPFSLLRRRTPLPLSLEDLPPIDFVLLSHNHYDHLDAKTVAYVSTFHPQTSWIVPLGMKSWFQKRGISSVYELGWWESHQCSRCTITAVPAQHFSGRTLWDKNRTLWNGYVFETGEKRFYFTGDTGYNEIDFKAIGNQWPYMDLSLIPIGTYSPQKFMQPVHINPYEAVQIHQDVRSVFSLGMHWKTFHLSDEPPERPPYDLYLAMKEKALPFETFLPIEIGLYTNW